MSEAARRALADPDDLDAITTWAAESIRAGYELDGRSPPQWVAELRANPGRKAASRDRVRRLSRRAAWFILRYVGFLRSLWVRPGEGHFVVGLDDVLDGQACDEAGFGGS